MKNTTDGCKKPTLSHSSPLVLKDIRKTYGEIVAVDRVNLELREGEFLTFLGPSGSGKTTTLAMVAGLQNPSSGSIYLNGEPLDPLPPYRRNIGMVFQHYALFPHMTVAGNVAFPLEMRKLPRSEVRKRVDEALELVGLPEMAKRFPAELSGGQQQRVALARAIVFKPPLLLMDEPLGALDRKLREQMQLEITRLHRELKTSILYVTHDQEEALVMSDRIAVFNKGLIEQIGSAHELYEKPMTKFVAGFLGDSNFFGATVREVRGDCCLLDSQNGPLRASNTSRLKAGDKAVVAVRPERISFFANGHNGVAHNTLKGRVTDIIYLGQSSKYVLKMPDGTEIRALQQAQTEGGHKIALGDEVSVMWHETQANALAEKQRD